MRDKNRASIDFVTMLVSDASLRCSKWFSEERVMAGDRCRSVEIVAGGSDFGRTFFFKKCKTHEFSDNTGFCPRG